MGVLFGVLAVFWLFWRGVPRRRRMGILCGMCAYFTGKFLFETRKPDGQDSGNGNGNGNGNGAGSGSGSGTGSGTGDGSRNRGGPVGIVPISGENPLPGGPLKTTETTASLSAKANPLGLIGAQNGGGLIGGVGSGKGVGIGIGVGADVVGAAMPFRVAASTRESTAADTLLGAGLSLLDSPAAVPAVPTESGPDTSAHTHSTVRRILTGTVPPVVLMVASAYSWTSHFAAGAAAAAAADTVPTASAASVPASVPTP
jgi:hypothetical protein